jgi:hypothetical protein
MPIYPTDLNKPGSPHLGSLSAATAGAAYHLARGFQGERL